MERKPLVGDLGIEPRRVREQLGDGSYGGLYERPDEDVLRVWAAGVGEVRDLLASGWRRDD
jgi:creatinine amidohydrolase